MKSVSILTGIMALPFMMFAQQRVSDGTANAAINPNAVLELQSNNKGLLNSRVALQATNLAAPLAAHVAGMTVYNTATAGSGATAVKPGYYYNDGTRWVKLQPVAESIVGSGAPTGACTTANIYTDTLSGSPTEGQQWTCDGTGWITYNSATAWYLSGGTTDAGGNKTADIYRNGSVGVGVTAPAAKLHVKSTSYNSAILESSSDNIPEVRSTAAAGTSTGSYLNFTRSAYSGYSSAGGSIMGGFLARNGSPANGAMGGILLRAAGPQSSTSTPSSMSFGINPTGQANTWWDRIRINPDGNVGIGTSAPTATLHTVGKVRIADGTECDGCVFTSSSNGTGDWVKGGDTANGTGIFHSTVAQTFVPTINTTLQTSQPIKIKYAGNYLASIRWWSRSDGPDVNKLVSAYISVLKNGVVMDQIEYYNTIENASAVFTFTVNLMVQNCMPNDIITIKVNPSIGGGQRRWLTGQFGTQPVWMPSVVISKQ